MKQARPSPGGPPLVQRWMYRGGLLLAAGALLSLLPSPRAAAAESEPADHVGLVLALFSALAARAADGEAVKGLIEDLWAAHVASWLPRFAATLVAEARMPALKATGQLLTDAVS